MILRVLLHDPPLESLIRSMELSRARKQNEQNCAPVANGPTAGPGFGVVFLLRHKI